MARRHRRSKKKPTFRSRGHTESEVDSLVGGNDPLLRVHDAMRDEKEKRCEKTRATRERRGMFVCLGQCESHVSFV
jgi:hypothetical protein